MKLPPAWARCQRGATGGGVGHTSRYPSRSSNARSLSMNPQDEFHAWPMLPPPSASGDTRMPAVLERIRSLPSSVGGSGGIGGPANPAMLATMLVAEQREACSKLGNPLASRNGPRAPLVPSPRERPSARLGRGRRGGCASYAVHGQVGTRSLMVGRARSSPRRLAGLILMQDPAGYGW